ncbi:MAG: hypothetical protein HY755_09235 [Nitrospirae bacterium]|nr:hypothetical protein [Nitrospirota bacterium]
MNKSGKFNSVVQKNYPCILGILFFVMPASILFIGTEEFLTIKKALGALFQWITTGYIAWAILYSYSTLNRKENIFSELMKPNNSFNYQEEINNIHKGALSYTIFLVVAICLFFTPYFLIGNPLPELSYQFYIAFLILSFVMGIAASTVYLIAHFMARYAKNQIVFSIFNYSHSKFQLIVKLQLRFVFITSVGYIFTALTTFFYWGFNKVTVGWYLAGIVFVLFFIFYPQMAFHNLLNFCHNFTPYYFDNKDPYKLICFLY